MSVSSVALSSLATSPPAPLPASVGGPHSQGTAASTLVGQSQILPPPQPQEPPVKAAVSPKVGQAIDISA